MLSRSVSETRLVMQAKAGAGVCELPFVASTSLDPLLQGNAAPGAMQRRRDAIRRELGMSGEAFDWMRPVPLGRGSFGIVPTSLLLCLQTASAWGGQGRAARILRESMSEWVVPQLTASPLHELNREMVKAVRGRLLEASREGRSMACLVNRAIRDYANATPALLDAAAAYGEAMGRVAENIEDVERVGGEVVRFEGDEALIVVHRPEGEELRWVAAPWLERFGLDEEGAPFMLYEQSWSPTRRLSYFQPAVLEGGLSEAERAAIEARVRAAARPLEEFEARIY